MNRHRSDSAFFKGIAEESKLFFVKHTLPLKNIFWICWKISIKSPNPLYYYNTLFV